MEHFAEGKSLISEEWLQNYYIMPNMTTINLNFKSADELCRFGRQNEFFFMILHAKKILNRNLIFFEKGKSNFSLSRAVGK